MEFFRNREELEFKIVTLHSEGVKIRMLSRHFKMGRNTIRKILKKHEAFRDKGHDRLEKQTIPRDSKLDPFIPFIKGLLERYPDITSTRICEELREKGYDGGKTIVFDRLKQLRPRPKKEPVIRFETAPGEQGQMDWSPYKITFSNGCKTEVLCFSYILGYSRRQYIDFTLNRKFFTLIRRHQDAFNHFEGVPRSCLYDGEKTILLRWEAGRPVYNPAFISFITHYRCKPIGCKPRRPQTKGKVEKPFSYIEKNLLNGRAFLDLDDLKRTAQWWLREKSDKHRHDTTGRPPIELFLEQEQTSLLPLPKHPYDTSEVHLRVCRCEGLVEFETNKYSVPVEYIADILAIKANENELFIYDSNLKLIAKHERFPLGAAKSSEKPEHRITQKKRYGLEPVRDVFFKIGDSAEEFLKGLQQKEAHHCGYHARFILNLKEHYHTESINKSLAHATRYYAFNCKAVERILKATAKRRTLESVRNRQANEVLKKCLPEIHQRSLSEYSQLFENNPEENETPPQTNSLDSRTD